MPNNPSLRLAIQAAIAMAIALSIQHFYHFERSYWAVFTSMILFSQTLGSSIKRALERVAMTILGGSLATLLYFVIPTGHIPIVSIILCSIFFQICFLQRFYLGSAFFASVFIVFFFALIQTWSVHLLAVRIFETILGAAITLACSFLIFPIKTENTLLAKIPLFIADAEALSAQILETLFFTKNNKREMLKKAEACLLLLSQLDQEYIHLGYELGRHHSKQEIKDTLRALSRFYHHLSSIVSWLSHLQDRTLFLALKEELQALLEATFQDLNDLNKALTQEKAVVFTNNFSIRYQILEQKAALLRQDPQYSRMAWLDYFAFCSFLKIMDETLKVLDTAEA
ncbi:MAG: FUSC family protein [Gammaproteobacteria bacterium]|nr:FUSC family protein [Gammaproteobacteria bacterium]